MKEMATDSKCNYSAVTNVDENLDLNFLILIFNVHSSFLLLIF